MSPAALLTMLIETDCSPDDVKALADEVHNFEHIWGVHRQWIVQVRGHNQRALFSQTMGALAACIDWSAPIGWSSLGLRATRWCGLLDPLAPWVHANARIAAPVFGTVAGLISGIIGAGAVTFISLLILIFAPGRKGFLATV